MAEPTHYCPSCYARNAWDRSSCAACGTPLSSDETYDDRLIWALRHPDTGTAILAAAIVARRRTRSAIPVLAQLATSGDPYRATAAARALTTFADVPGVAPILEGLREHPWRLVRRAVEEATVPPSEQVEDRLPGPAVSPAGDPSRPTGR